MNRLKHNRYCYRFVTKVNTLKWNLAKHCNLQPSHLSNTIIIKNNATTTFRRKYSKEEVIELHSAIEIQDIATTSFSHISNNILYVLLSETYKYLLSGPLMIVLVAWTEEASVIVLRWVTLYFCYLSRKKQTILVLLHNRKDHHIEYYYVLLSFFVD